MGATGPAGPTGPTAVPIVRPEGLRRWRASFGDALFARAPVVCVGDSITWGAGADGTKTATLDTAVQPAAWVTQLSALFAAQTGDPGEGFLMVNDSRITAAGAPMVVNFVGPLRYGFRLLAGAGQTLTFTVPAGTTSVGVVQPHRAGDASAQIQVDGGAATAVATIAGDGVYRETETTVTPGTSHTIVLSAPASGAGYVAGVTIRKGTVGVPVHRIGKTGNACGAMLGGATTGVPDQTAPNQDLSIRALMQWEKPGVMVIGFGVNDQALQAGTGQHAGVTPTLYDAWIRQVCTTAISLGWCVLLLGEPRNPNAPATGAPEQAYRDVLKAIALSLDHVACLDIGDVWGLTSWADATMGLHVLSTSVHPSRRGHGDIARIICSALTGARAFAP